MKRLGIGFLVIFLLLGSGVFTSFLWFNSQISAHTPGSTVFQTIIISPNQSASATYSDLASLNLIKSELAAKIYARINRLDQKIRPGTYSVSPSMSVSEILKAISSGPQDIRVTIPEGWRREQIAALLQSTLTSSFSATEFLSLTASLEGQLFPDTYFLPPTSTAAEVVEIISNNFTKRVGQLDRDTLIMASLIEREARESTDRPIVAGVLKNRLDADWPLQVDATVQYGRDSQTCASRLTNCEWWSPPRDTQISTIYNTYLHTGLPPSPICNPGLASIEAARRPATTPYWYYLTGNDGITYFARDLDEHNRNVDKHLNP